MLRARCQAQDAQISADCDAHANSRLASARGGVNRRENGRHWTSKEAQWPLARSRPPARPHVANACRQRVALRLVRVRDDAH